MNGFVTVDSETILNNLILQFQEALGETLYQGDERRIFLEQQALVLVALYNAINSTGNQNLLKYAKGSVLDDIGERTNVTRIAAQKAVTTLRFTLSSAQAAALTVPAGTRATPDGKLFFATTTDLIISAGSTYGDVIAQGTGTGEDYNGFVAGQISQLVDPVAYVASVSNTITSSGGSNIEADDDGENIWSGFRERIRESVTSFSTAGPTDAYIYWAKSANSNIGDVTTTLIDKIKEFNSAAFQTAYPEVDPTPFYTEISSGKVKINILMADGSLPTQEILDSVLAVCNNKKIRPLTDNITANAPATTSYDIALTYYISRDNTANESVIRTAIEDTGGVIDTYKNWQNSKMGRAINPDELRKLMLNAGASHISITAPVYTAVAEDAVATTGTVTVTYGGLE